MNKEILLAKAYELAWQDELIDYSTKKGRAEIIYKMMLGSAKELGIDRTERLDGRKELE